MAKAKAKKEEVALEAPEAATEPEAVEATAEELAPKGKGKAGFPESVEPLRTKFGPAFKVVRIGDEARVYGKRGEPVSPVTTLSEASKLASQFNRRDPEQIEARSRKTDPKKNVLAERAADEDARE
ncbi:MAG: hypothetical protein Q8L86_12495 [Vicinamibacterales bacterium]|nr:hypothetical protein [Vicinamibacterales bacterium]